RLKFPDQNVAGFIASLPSPSDPGIEALALAREKGPDYMLAAFEFIPPDQVSRRNFKKRLEIEQTAREKGEQKAERVIRVTGGIQDVGFRGFCQKRAWIWGITGGSATNEFDGSVTVLIQGCPSILEAYSKEEDFKNHAWESKISVHRIEVLEDRKVTEELTEFSSLYAKRPPEEKKPSFLRRIFGR
ncbi:MAG: acylphosphatase, partial [Patescibacteria group bacterium]